ncbi:efflux RND transporter periplasmic adaptor subunit [Roseovarius bejariae]|uniref:efflux RND transporter periplasmic adaptor subunit n=1 Tax=Roseovarius bejariae TaxID=2576383 RepID=UPI0012ADADB4|nr:efflux transporter periplasmic adaptor subunit [Roseovarius bejariae]
MKRTRILRLLPPVAVGIGLAVWLISGAEPPERVEGEVRSVTARVLTVTPQEVPPRLHGYGTVRPARSWQAVAEVAGAVTYRHPDLETGKIIPAGTKVLEIDTTRYDLALRQAMADLAALRAERAQIDLEAENTQSIVKIEQDRLALAESDLERVRTLVEQGTAPESRLDEQRRATLLLRRAVRELENTLALVPSRRARLEAQIARAEAGRDRARRELDLTRIETPFAVRIGKVHAERHQFVPAGGPLVTADGTARAEVTAQFPIDGFPRLVGAVAGDGVDLQTADQEAVLGKLDAQLRLVSDMRQTWQARVIRIENALDPQARSVPVVLSVEAPYAGAHPPLSLPLVPNMYVEAILTGPPGAPRVVIPANAVHEGDTVYLRDQQGRLALRTVEVGWRQDGMAVINEGLSEGDEVIVDDVVPALPGLRVIPAGQGQ